MITYNRTAVKSAVYDSTGVISNVEIRTGIPVCLYFSLGGALGMMDMCMNIMGDGTPEGRYTLWYGDIAGGTFKSNSNKTLPQCNRVNVPAISSSVYASLGALASKSSLGKKGNKAVIVTMNHGSTVKTFTSFPTLTTPTKNVNAATVEESENSNKGNQIALGIGLEMVNFTTKTDAILVLVYYVEHYQGLPTVMLAALDIWFHWRRPPVKPLVGQVGYPQGEPPMELLNNQAR
ncbi:MAG: hypothetical protein Q9167_006145 [Letrouitia subvulpina]